MLKPHVLKDNATIGLICPSSPTNKLEKSIDVLKNFGYNVKIGQSCYLHKGYLAGDKITRAMDINNMFRDDEVDAIFALRGGYGSMQCLPYIDFELVRNNPKIFLGYSDITSLHLAFNSICELITFHGPMPSVDFLHDDGFSLCELFNTLKCPSYFREFHNPKGYELHALKSGMASGKLIGGNLSVIVSTIGSPYEIDTTDGILFIEDINESPYKIDKMLYTLKLSNKLNSLKGIILGDFNNCASKDEEDNVPLEEIFQDVFRDLNIPVIAGLSAGHCSPMITLPLGINISIDSDNLRIYTKDCPIRQF